MVKDEIAKIIGKAVYGEDDREPTFKVREVENGNKNSK